jgi:hypothetical protein
LIRPCRIPHNEGAWRVHPVFLFFERKASTESRRWNFDDQSNQERHKRGKCFQSQGVGSRHMGTRDDRLIMSSFFLFRAELLVELSLFSFPILLLPVVVQIEPTELISIQLYSISLFLSWLLIK